MDPMARLLHRKARAVAVGIAALTAKGHIGDAHAEAVKGGIDRSIVIDLERAREAADRAARHAEQCARRIGRRLDRLYATPSKSPRAERGNYSKD